MTRPWLEQMRAYVEGRLTETEAAEFWRTCESDPERMDALSTYELVARATTDSVPLLKTRFEDLPLEPVRPSSRRTRWWVGAALALLAVSWSFWGARGGQRGEPRAQPTVALSTLGDAWETAAARTGKAVANGVVADGAQGSAWDAFALVRALPADFIEHRTADEFGLIWKHDLEEALQLARAANRRVLLFVEFPDCPLCLGYDKDEFRSDVLRRAADAYVLVRLDLRETPAALALRSSEGWPLFFVIDPSTDADAGANVDAGARDWSPVPVATLKGDHDAATLAKFLGAHAPTAPTWIRWMDVAIQVRAMQDSNPLAEQYRVLARAAELTGSLRDAAARARAHLDADAVADLRAAKDAPRAQRVERLLHLVERYADTPHEADFRAIYRALKTHDAWPKLTAAYQR